MAITATIIGGKGRRRVQTTQENVNAVEREVLAEVLKSTGGKKAKAARLLQIDYKTIHGKVKKFGIQEVS